MEYNLAQLKGEIAKTLVNEVYNYSGTEMLDIPEYSPKWNAVSWGLRHNIVTGYTDGTFKPNQKITRAEFTKIALNAKDIQLNNNESQLKFSDVNEKDWFFDYIKTVYSLGIIEGYKDNTFKPNNSITLPEAIKISLGIFNIVPDNKLEGSNWYDIYMNYAKEEGLLENTLLTLPDYEISRGEMMDIIYRIALITGDINNNFPKFDSNDNTKTNKLESKVTVNVRFLRKVTRVIDGDTVEVESDSGEKKTVRLIGIDAPETNHPSKGKECFGNEAKQELTDLILNKDVNLEYDDSQDKEDKYGRTLAYIFLDGTNINQYMIEEGYAYEYTYNKPYKYQIEFKQSQEDAKDYYKGLWSYLTCEGKRDLNDSKNEDSSIKDEYDYDDYSNDSDPINSYTEQHSSQPSSSSCNIKGNISSNDEKIYHLEFCGSYSRTIIDESKGERWFCSEEEAINAGWRKALNCN